MAERITFHEKGRVAYETFDPPRVDAHDVRIRTTYSQISTGTETIALNGLFDAGTHWADWIRYPFHPGYSSVGVIEEVGPGVADFATGDLVVAPVGHASDHVVDALLCTSVPGGVAPEHAVWFALAHIALMGARAAAYELGDSVAVIGAGPIGQMSTRWANAAGVKSLVVIDPVTARLDIALAGGATGTVAAPIGEAGEAIASLSGGKKPRVVIDTTGNAEVLASALALVADFGRLVVLGDTGFPTGQHLTPDVIRRGITIVGAHATHSQKGSDWDGNRSIYELFFHLQRTGRFPMDGLNTHFFAPKDFQAAYDITSDRRVDSMGIIFAWR
jgi:2-desacetyl-2-hydroxyethyl bacteriochlorophyllide A dehydrogenase